MSGWRKVISSTAFNQNWVDPHWDNLRIDPYLIWAALTNFRDAGGKPTDWIWVILELSCGITAKSFSADMARRPDNQGPSQWMMIDALYSNPHPAFSDATFCTALVKSKFFEELLRAPLRESVKRFEIAMTMIPESYVTTQYTAPPTVCSLFTSPEVARANCAGHHASPNKVSCIVGVIDDGIAFANERFRDSSGRTRIEFMWDQGNFIPSDSTTAYGRELKNGDINALMALAQSSTSTLDEDALYRMIQYDETRRRFAHGTFVLDIASGMDPSRVDDETPRIIAVQLQSPSRRTRDRGTGWLNARTLDGLRYILQRATEVKAGETPPVVINLSYGLMAGPHDGSGMLEEAMDQLIRLGNGYGMPVNIVIAAGNSNLSRSHAHLRIPTGESKTLCWRALPDDPSPNFLEIWLPRLSNGSAPAVRVRAKPPTTNHSAWIGMDETWAWQSNTDVLCTVTSRRVVATGGQGMILMSVAPTSPASTAIESAPIGNWDIEIENLHTEDIDIQAWIQRDETPYTFPLFGRQSRLADPNYIAFDQFGYALDMDPAVRPNPPSPVPDWTKAFISRKSTLNAIATGAETIVVGGFQRGNGIPARYSSSGPTLDNSSGVSAGFAPKVVAVSDDSTVTRGVLGAGTRSSAVTAINGTSVAAPQITRWIAERFSNGTFGRATNVKDSVCSEADSQEGCTSAFCTFPVKNPTYGQPGYAGKPDPIRGGKGRIETPPMHAFESGFGHRPR